jgi:hypothetical protein
MKTNIIFDYMRGTRTNKDGESSYSMLKSLKVKNY